MDYAERATDCPPIPDSGKLYLTVPTSATKKLLCSETSCAGFEFDEPFSDVLAVPVSESQLRELARLWSDSLSLAELNQTKCYLAGSLETPSYADLMKAQTLAGLIDRVNGQWLKEVIDAGRLVTHFQPIVRSAEPDVVYGYECLLRGYDPEGQLISPFQLYSAARGAGLLDCLDCAARLTAIESASQRHLSTCVFINFNPRSIDDSRHSIHSALRAALASSITTENYVFEVVESDEISDIDSLMDIADDLRVAGCRVALDDVGAGYNSLNLVALLKPDFIKIDMGLMRDVDHDDYKARVTAKLLELARELGVQTVVEGVETQREWEWACEHGADFAQGYLFARPAIDPPTSQFIKRYFQKKTSSPSEILAPAQGRRNSNDDNGEIVAK